jgi:uncharacterized protein YbjT (DUF2867 family)
MILLTGATGTVGSVLARKLLARGAAVRALVRNPAHAADLAALGVELAPGDFERPDTLATALKGVDAAFLLSPASDKQVEHENAFIDAAAAARIRFLVKHSAVGADEDAPPPGGSHHQIELHLARSGVPHILVRPTQFMDIFLQWVPPIERVGALVMPLVDPDVQVNQIDVDDVADVEAALLMGGGEIGAVYTPTGPELITYGEMAMRLSRGAGVPIPLITVSPDDYRRTVIQAGAPRSEADRWIEYYSTLRRGRTALAVTTEDVARVTGHAPTSLEVFARHHSDALRPYHAPTERPQPSM